MIGYCKKNKNHKYIAITIVLTVMLVATAAFSGDTAFAGFIIDPINRKAPIAIVGDNVYIAWPSNRTGNDVTEWE